MSWLLPPLTPHFHAALRDVHAGSFDARIRAAERLGMADASESDRALKALKVLIEDAHPKVRATAMAGLAELASEGCLPEVVAGLDDPSPGVREWSVVALARIGGPDAREHLHQSLHHRAAEVRFQAVAAIAERYPDQAAQHALECIDDDDPHVRAQVADVLGRHAQPRFRGHLGRLLDDQAREVRLEAALGLARQLDPRGEAELLRAARERYRTHEVCAALGRVASSQGREILANLASGLWVPANDRAAAAAALLQAGDERGVPAMRRVLRGGNTQARNYAVRLVGKARGLALLPELARLCRKRGTDRLAMCETLTQLGDAGADVAAALKSLAQDRSDEAAERAQSWLESKLAPSSPGPWAWS